MGDRSGISISGRPIHHVHSQVMETEVREWPSSPRLVSAGATPRFPEFHLRALSSRPHYLPRFSTLVGETQVRRIVNASKCRSVTCTSRFNSHCHCPSPGVYHLNYGQRPLVGVPDYGGMHSAHTAATRGCHHLCFQEKCLEDRSERAPPRLPKDTWHFCVCTLRSITILRPYTGQEKVPQTMTAISLSLWQQRCVGVSCGPRAVYMTSLL